jgi:hypothetical protein
MTLLAVPNYEGLYLIGSDGHIESIERKGNQKKSRILKGGTDQNGYSVVTLCKDGKQKTFRVHRLVAMAFIPNPNGYSEINHKDENKSNNAIENLEWCDRKYNVRYGTRTKKTQKGVLQFDKRGNLLNVFDGVRMAAFSIGSNTCGGISNCCNGKSKSAYGYIWRWLE